MRCFSMRLVSLLLGVAPACVWVAYGGFASAAVAKPGSALPAVWRERRLDFVYVGRTSRYSCDGLRDKVRAMLMDLGARRDVTAVVVGCADAARLSIVFSAPAASSPPAPDSAAKPGSGGGQAAMAARYEPFTITSDAFRNMGMGDCELVAEFARQILPTLATRGVKQDAACMIRGEVLKIVPLKDS